MIQPTDTKQILAVDFGGTKLAAGTTCTGFSRWQAFQSILLPPNVDAEGSLLQVIALVAKLQAETPEPFDAIGVSFGGPVDQEQGVVHLSHHVPGWEHFPLRNWLEERFGAPAVIANDANAAAFGEHQLGAGRGCRSMMYITISTGIGGGLVLDGNLWTGQDGMAGEIGHMVIDPEGPLCTCGKRGCLESFASGSAIARQAMEMLQDKPQPGLIFSRFTDQTGEITARTISQACAEGDELAREILEAAAAKLGTGIGNAANLLNLERFILGGGVTKAGEGWWDAVRRAAQCTILPGIQISILPAQLGDDAPLWGAKILAELHASL